MTKFDPIQAAKDFVYRREHGGDWPTADHRYPQWVRDLADEMGLREDDITRYTVAEEYAKMLIIEAFNRLTDVIPALKKDSNKHLCKTKGEKIPVSDSTPFNKKGWLGINCLSDDCPIRKDCANHFTAGDFRGEDGGSPLIDKVGNEYFCAKKFRSNGHGSVIFDGKKIKIYRRD